MKGHISKEYRIIKEEIIFSPEEIASNPLEKNKCIRIPNDYGMLNYIIGSTIASSVYK